MKPIILGIGGSLRPQSTATMALKLALEGAKEAGAITQHLDLAELSLPLFNGTYSIDGYTNDEQQKIIKLLEAVNKADGLIIASPTYHNSISGSLKNALELLEVNFDLYPSLFKGKVVGLASVQGGTSGTGINTLTTMLLATRAMGAWVAPTMVNITGSEEAFNESGQLYDVGLIQRLHALGNEVTKSSLAFNTVKAR